MAAPPYIGSSATTLTGSTAITSGSFAEPAGVGSGDGMIARVRWYNTATAAAIPGWTLLGYAKQPNQGLNTAWLFIRRGSSAPSLTVTFSGGTATSAGVSVDAWDAVTGVEIIGSLTTQTTFSSTHATSAVSTSLDNDTLVALFSLYQGSATAASSGWTLRGSTLMEKMLASHGASGTASVTSSQNTWATTLMVALASNAIPTPEFPKRPTVTYSGALGVGRQLTASGTARYALAHSYAWKRRKNGTTSTISGQTAQTYTTTTSDNGATVWPEVTATNATGSASAAAFPVSFYTAQTDDIGHDVTAHVVASNSAGDSDAADSDGVEILFRNLTPPTISGGESGMEAGVTLTAVAGTYQETVTGRTWQWMADNVDIPGATSDTFTPDVEYGGWRIRVREMVTGPLGRGTTISTDKRYFPTMAIPFLQDASPWFEEIPADAPVDAAMSATFQGWLSGQQAGTGVWWTNGGPNGQGFSSFVNIVRSSADRVAWNLSPVNGQPTNYTTPVKNGGEQAHLAWSWGVKNDGVPTHPCGYKIDSAGDHTIHIFCPDTNELWSGWVARNAGDIGNELPQINWGSYIPDVTQYIGYCQDLLGPGNGGYAPGTTDEYQYKNWGDAAIYPSLPGMIQQTYLQAGEIPHMLGLLMPGNNQGSPRYPGLRSEPNGFYSPMPPGGIIRLDPTLDPDTLPSLGSQARNDIRRMFVTALQKHGMSILDTALSVIAAFRIEDAQFYQDSWSYQGTSLNSIMRSIPITAYQYLSTSYRPAGTPTPPPNRAIDTYRLTAEDMLPYSGCTLDATGRLTLNAASGALCYAHSGLADLTNDGIYFRITQAASVLYCQVKVGSNNTTDGFWFKIDTGAGTLRAECRYSNSTVGTDTSVSYSPTSHAWGRLRHSGGNLIWEVSEDVAGVPGSWTQVRSQAVPGSFWDITACFPTFYCPPGGTGTAVVTNLNQVPASVAVSSGWVVGIA